MLKSIKIEHFIIILGTVIASWGALFKCQYYVGLDFDSQSFIYWDYVRFLDLVPYKDFFYPYGLLFYFKTDSLLINLFIIILLLVILTSVYKIIATFSKQKYLSYSIFLLYCLFINLFIDFNTFIRYGSVFPLIYYLSKITSSNEFFKTKNSLIVGLIIGLFFSFINDVFFYSLIIYICFLAYNLVYRYRTLSVNLFVFTSNAIVGFLLGALFLLSFLIINNSIGPFLENYKLLFEIASFAKVPFPPSLRIFENVFNIGIIIISIFYLLTVRKKDLRYFSLASILLMILLLEQKNIVRSFYSVISIFGMLFFYFYLIQVYLLLKKKVSNKLSLVFISSQVLLITVIMYIGLPHFENNSKISDSIKNSCYESKLNKLTPNELEYYYEIKERYANYMIFSFPGDPVFYALFKQKPPPYPSVYESTPVFAQDKQIKFIKKNNIELIIINTSSDSIQDGVPDKLRNKKLYDYIFENYSYHDEVGSFMILKRI